MSDDENEEVADLSNPDVTTKYQAAAGIVNKALELVLKNCLPDKDIYEICELGDKYINEECGKLYNKREKGKDGKEGRKIEKGVASPTCISCNELAGHFSPLKGESQTLKAGDIAKIDMACHIDGYIAAVGHTVIVGDGEVTEGKADVIHAAWTAAEAALRLVTVGTGSKKIIPVFQKCADAFKVQPITGVMSHQMKRHIIHGNKVIPIKENVEEKTEEFEVETNEVYCIDVMMSTGEGKGRETELRSTVFKRAVETSYQLKTQKARQFIGEVNRRFPTLPFSLRAFEDEQMARVGVSEAKRHELLHEYPVLREREGEIIAQFKFTVLILPGGTKKVTGLPLGDLATRAKTTKAVEDEELKALLAQSANPKKAKKKKKEDKGGYADGGEKEG